MGNPAGVRRDFVALQQRRHRAARLLAKGLNQSEVARRVGVHRQSVSRWVRQLEREGRRGLKRAGRAGRKPRLRAQDLERIRRALKRGPEALGYETGLWTAARVAHLIEQECGVQYHPGHVWRLLRQLGWSCHWNGTKPPSGSGNGSAGRRLKKSPKRGAHPRLCRRKRTERAAPSLPDLGPARADAGAPIPL